MRILVSTLAVSSAAGAASTVSSMSPARNPNGCFMFVHERTAFAGAGNVINEPVRLHSLDRLDVDGNRERRIRSLRIGGAVSVTAFTERNLLGQSVRLAPATATAHLDSAMAGHIRSLVLDCGLTER